MQPAVSQATEQLSFIGDIGVEGGQVAVSVMPRGCVLRLPCMRVVLCLLVQSHVVG